VRACARRAAVRVRALISRALRVLRAVLELMGDNAFAERPPKFIRASLYQYHFTSSDNNDDRSVLRTASKSGQYW